MRWPALAMMLLGIGACTKPGDYPEQKICSDSERKVAAVWTQGRKVAIETSVTSHGQEHLAKTWSTAAARVDEYASEWIEQDRQSCQVAHEGRQSVRLSALRKACLEDRLSELATFVEALKESTPVSANFSARAAMWLRPVSDCSADALGTSAIEPDPSYSFADARAAIARAHTLASLGLYDESQGQVRPKLGNAVLAAEARYALGRGLGLNGELAAAEEELSEATWRAASQRDDRVAALAAAELVRVVGRQAGRFDDGVAWARHAEAAVARIGGMPRLRTGLKLDRGALRLAAGELDEAQQDLEQALAEYERRPDGRLGAIESQRLLADLFAARDKTDESFELFMIAKSQTQAVLGKTHPEVALSLIGLARAEARQRHDAATALYREALGIVGAALGSEHPMLVPILRELGGHHLGSTQERDKALEHLGRAAKTLQAHLGEHPRVAIAYCELGDAYVAAGQARNAALSYALALEMFVDTGERSDVEMAYPLTALGELEVDGANSVELLERALKLRGARGVPQHLRARTQFALARALWEHSRDRDRAVELAKKARSGFKGRDKDHFAVHAWISERQP